jgi:hypothetical protein
MTPNSTGTRTALRGLDQALDAPRKHGAQKRWRKAVRQGMASLHECLDHETAPASEGWLAARSGVIVRERDALLGRMSILGPAVQTTAEVDTVREELKRLLADISHHLQRLHDLAYDDVELELGGSE